MKAAQRGFSLLEVLVAFVILALALGVLMRVFSGGLNSVVVSDRYAHATFLAESKLAALGIETPLEEGEASGEADRDYRWQSRISRYQSPTPTPEGTTLPVALFQVEVTVSWDSDAREPRRVRLSTLRVGPKP